MIICQVSYLDICREDDTDTSTGTRDMHQYHALHQLFVLLQFFPDLKRIFYMVDVEHHEPVHMTAHQLAPCTFLGLTVLGFHRCLVKLIAAELESRQRFLQIIRPG